MPSWEAKSAWSTCGPDANVPRLKVSSPSVHYHPSPVTCWHSRWMTSMAASRSEEHTSELQSRLHLVCRLLLEKKKHIIPTAPHPPLPHIFSQPTERRPSLHP